MLELKFVMFVKPNILKKIMFRSYFTLLFVFLCVHFTVSAQDLEFQKVSVDTVFPQKLMLSWLPNAHDSITIYWCENNCHIQGNYIKIGKSKMDFLQWVDDRDTLRPKIKNYYRIGGGGIGSEPQNNMVLKTSAGIDGCKNSVSLSWNSYINMMDTLDYYTILYREKGKNAPFTILDSIKGVHYSGFDFKDAIDLSYTAKYLEKFTVYEFVIQANNKSRTNPVFSNIAESEKTGDQPNNPIDITISQVSVIEDKYIQIDVAVLDTFQQLYFYRAMPGKEVGSEEALQFEPIYSTNYSNSDTYSFLDKNVNPHAGLYYYKASATHACKIDDQSKNILTNIYLKGGRIASYQDTISFTRVEIPAGNPSEPFELLRIINNDEKTSIADLTLTNNKYTIDVLPFMKLNGAVIQYQIKSKNKDCYSNIITIEHEPYTQFPNAFYPQSIRAEDRTFYPIIKFPPVIDAASKNRYSFVIYNRWGEMVYQSELPPVYNEYSNLQGRWDGTDLKGRDCPSGIYSFTLFYSFNEGTGKHSETGSVMLVR